jgi:hypothetical protein
MIHDISSDVIYDTNDDLVVRRKLLQELEEQYPKLHWVRGDKPTKYDVCEYRYIYIIDKKIYHNTSFANAYADRKLISYEQLVRSQKNLKERIKEFKI